jgi:hypothetical protein
VAPVAPVAWGSSRASTGLRGRVRRVLLLCKGAKRERKKRCSPTYRTDDSHNQNHFWLFFSATPDRRRSQAARHRAPNSWRLPCSDTPERSRPSMPPQSTPQWPHQHAETARSNPTDGRPMRLYLLQRLLRFSHKPPNYREEGPKSSQQMPGQAMTIHEKRNYIPANSRHRHQQLRRPRARSQGAKQRTIQIKRLEAGPQQKRLAGQNNNNKNGASHNACSTLPPHLPTRTHASRAVRHRPHGCLLPGGLTANATKHLAKPAPSASHDDPAGVRNNPRVAPPLG